MATIQSIQASMVNRGTFSDIEVDVTLSDGTAVKSTTVLPPELYSCIAYRRCLQGFDSFGTVLLFPREVVEYANKTIAPTLIGKDPAADLFWPSTWHFDEDIEKMVAFFAIFCAIFKVCAVRLGIPFVEGGSPAAVQATFYSTSMIGRHEILIDEAIKSSDKAVLGPDIHPVKFNRNYNGSITDQVSSLIGEAVVGMNDNTLHMKVPLGPAIRPVQLFKGNYDGSSTSPVSLFDGNGMVEQIGTCGNGLAFDGFTDEGFYDPMDIDPPKALIWFNSECKSMNVGEIHSPDELIVKTISTAKLPAGQYMFKYFSHEREIGSDTTDFYDFLAVLKEIQIQTLDGKLVTLSYEDGKLVTVSHVDGKLVTVSY